MSNYFVELARKVYQDEYVEQIILSAPPSEVEDYIWTLMVTNLEDWSISSDEFTVTSEENNVSCSLIEYIDIPEQDYIVLAQYLPTVEFKREEVEEVLDKLKQAKEEL